MLADATDTALIVPVPAAEPVVAEHRLRLDPSAAWGVPAHVTVLHPFVPPSTVGFAEDVLWLSPEPADPFRDLTNAVWRAFPDHPPYSGAYDDLAPHLTVGQRPDDDPGQLRAIEPVVTAQLPVTSYVDRVHLVAGSTAPRSWRTVHVLELRPAS